MSPGRIILGALAVGVTVSLGLGAFVGWRWSTSLLPTTPDIPAAASVSARATGLLDMRRLATAVDRWSTETRLTATVASLESSLSAVDCAIVSSGDRRLISIGAETTLSAGPAQHLLIGATALEVLGADHRFVTEIRGPAPVEGIITGDLVIVGGGDPMLFSDLALPLAAEVGLPATVGDELVTQVLGRGVIGVTGDLLGVDDRYDQLFIAPELAGRAPRPTPIASLVVNRGLLVGATYALNPVQAAAAEFGRLLARQGVLIGGRSRATTTLPIAELDVLAQLESSPLSDIVAAMIESRDGATADMLLKEIGHASSGRGTRASGAGRLVTEAADPTNPPRIVEGWGLAEENRLGCLDLADAVTRLLDHLDVDTFEYVEEAGSTTIAIGAEPGMLAVIIGPERIDPVAILEDLRIDRLEAIGPST